MASDDKAQEKRKMTRKDASTARSLINSLMTVQSCKRRSQRKEAIRTKSLEKKFKKSLMVTWDEHDKKDESEKDENKSI